MFTTQMIDFILTVPQRIFLTNESDPFTSARYCLLLPAILCSQAFTWQLLHQKINRGFIQNGA
jgi:hypothetical protein